MAFIGAEPQRAGDITFSPAYVEIDATYLVQPGSPLRGIDDIDRDGVHIATAARAAYTLFLQRTLRHAALVEADGLPAAFDRFVDMKLDALAGLKPNLLANAAKIPGARVLDGRFTSIQQAIGVPKSRTAAARLPGKLRGRDHDLRTSARPDRAPSHRGPFDREVRSEKRV